MKKIIFFGLSFLIAFFFLSKEKENDQVVNLEPYEAVQKETISKTEKLSPQQALAKHIETSKRKVQKIVTNSSLSQGELDLISNFKLKPRDIIKSVRKNQPEFLNSLAKGSKSLKECLQEDLCGAREEFEDEEYFDENNTYYHNQLQRMLQVALHAKSPSEIQDAFPQEELSDYISSPGTNLLVKEAALDLMIEIGADTQLILSKKQHFLDGSLASFYLKLLKKDSATAKIEFIKSLNNSDINDTKDLLSVIAQFQLSEQETKQSIFNLCRFSNHSMSWPVVSMPLNNEIKRQGFSLDPKQICE